jgi:hypothetical protein
VQEFVKKLLPRIRKLWPVLWLLPLYVVVGVPIQLALQPPDFIVSAIHFADAGDEGDGFHKLHVTAAVKSNAYTASPYCSVKALTKDSAEVGLGDDAFTEQQFKVSQTWQLVNDGVHVHDEDMAKIDHIGISCMNKS